MIANAIPNKLTDFAMMVQPFAKDFDHFDRKGDFGGVLVTLWAVQTVGVGAGWSKGERVDHVTAPHIEMVPYL
ncbi:MAG: hypothetical protein AAF386_03830 [Pseudomonadota bacterium]